MKSWTSVVGLLLAGFFVHGCNHSHSANLRSALVSESPEVGNLQNDGKINFKGVSFTYNTKIFGNVITEEVVEYPLRRKDDKPDGVAPRHINFIFDLGKEHWKANIAVYPINDFPRMYAKNVESKRAIEKEIEDLRKAVKNMDLRFDEEIPHLPFVDASKSFQAKLKHFPFQDGSGVLFVTHWSTEAALISNDHLQYMFEGMTNDGNYYVVAEMPVKVAFLPADPGTEEFEGYKLSYLMEDYLTPDSIQPRYRDYIRGISARIAHLPPQEFQPNLRYFEEMISSMKIAIQIKH